MSDDLRWKAHDNATAGCFACGQRVEGLTTEHVGAWIEQHVCSAVEGRGTSDVDHDERCCMTVAGATEPHDICPGIPVAGRTTS